MPRRQSRKLAAVVVVVAVVASACAAGRDATGELADALSGLVAEPFAYAVTLDLDGDAVGQLLGPGAGAAAGPMNSLVVGGARTADAFSLTAELLGIETLGLRSYDHGRDLFLRVGLREVTSSLGDDLDAMVSAVYTDAPQSVEDLWSAILAGRWVGFVDRDRDAIDEQRGKAEDGLSAYQLLERLRARFEDPEVLLRDVTVITETDIPGGSRYDLAIRSEAALGELQKLVDGAGEGPDQPNLEADLQEVFADAPERIPGVSATVRDGDLTELRFDLGALLASLDQTRSEVVPGDLVVLVAFSEHGSVSVPPAPDDAHTYTQQQLDAFLEFLRDGVNEFTGADVESAVPASDLVPSLVLMQLSHKGTTGTFTDDLRALFDGAPAGLSESLPRGATYGVCLYDDGERFVVAAENGDGPAYADSSYLVTEDVTYLGCLPELAPLEPTG